jgi:hypothetical protein
MNSKLLNLNDGPPPPLRPRLFLLLLLILVDITLRLRPLQSLNLDPSLIVLLKLALLSSGFGIELLALLGLFDEFGGSAEGRRKVSFGVEKSGSRGPNSPVKDSIGRRSACETLARLGEPLDRACRVKVMTTEGNDGVLVERLAADEAGEGEFLVVGIVVFVCSTFSSSLLGHEGSGGGVGGEERVVELPAV